ncbi:MAG: hypothetical protein H6696_20455 [Deferribacteres bacterium]|nr:hypothetical protein [candidate division KSB1 bacterium]MCB9504303.1 hypothetical protein [Deferribacteres bacterium]
MKTRAKITMLFAFFLVSTMLNAQHFTTGLNFTLGKPQGEFKTNIDRNGYGGSLFFMAHAPNSPLAAGVEVGILNYGHESRSEPFSTTIPDVTVRVNTNNNAVLSSLFLRLQPQNGFIRPYIGGSIGFSYFYTETSIKDEDSQDNEDIASTTNLDDAAFSYGGDFGASVLLYKNKATENSEIPRTFEVLFDFKARYLNSGEAEYLKEGSIRRENGEVTYDVSQSRTEMMTYHFGFLFRF